MINKEIMDDFKNEFPKMLEEYFKAHDDFYVRGVATASTPARVMLLRIREMCQKARFCIQEDRLLIDKERKEAKAKRQ